MKDKPYIVLEYNDNLKEILLNNPEYEQKEIFNFKGGNYITLISKEYSLELKKEREILEIKLELRKKFLYFIIVVILVLIASHL